MPTLTLGPAAAAFAAILTIIGSVPNSEDVDRSLCAFVVSLTLGIAGYMLHSLEEESESHRLKFCLWLLAALIANVGHVALVAGIYYLIKNKNADASWLFLIMGGSLYVVFSLIFVGTHVFRKNT